MRKLLAVLLLLTMLVPAALAEETVSCEPLPTDLTTIPHKADPALFTETGYEDPTLSVTMEHIWVDDARYNVARVKISDPSQLRTGLASANAKRTNKVSAISRNHNAVVAIGGDYFSKDSYGYVVRMGEVFRKKPIKQRDMLLIDANGDFHILKNSDSEQLQALLTGDVAMPNVFNFGPALVIDGGLQEMPKDYKYNIDGNEPRCAIGQVGPLEYLLVVVDGRDAADSKGCTAKELAQFMFDQGCQQAYNLDGGNSALMYFGGANFSQKSEKAERSVSDIIYFATLVDYGLDAEE